MNAGEDLSPLLAPFRLGGLEMRNRIVCSPISINLADGRGHVSDFVVQFYAMMGKTGVGMVTIGASSVSPEGGSTNTGTHVGKPEFEPGLRRLADAVRETGALSSLQIFHVGAQGNTAYSGQPVLGPSAYVCPDIGIMAHPLEPEDIARIEDEFVDAVISGLNCSFDFVELHLAHGYLLHQFLSPYFNHRTDRYGGSPGNRLRIMEAIAEKLARREPAALRRIGCRISGNDFLPDGMTIESNRPVVDLLEALGCAYWVVSAGIYDTAKQKPIHMARGDYWRYAGELRRFARAPVVAQGGIRSLETGARILRDGQGDLIGLAQALIADPLIIEKSAAGRSSEVVPCLECGRCRYLKRKDLTFDCVRPEGAGGVRPEGGGSG
ncbi:MAG: NADH:flavin oxidoreductase [Alphaproteobacteria bacterium]|nr:NADH:flavin oxidoreductase [Alphaproteobacteria bacterium]